MARATAMFCTYLVLDNGGLVKIECPEIYMDEFYDSINHATKIGDFWNTYQLNDCHAEFLGIYLDRVNMARVVGIL